MLLACDFQCQNHIVGYDIVWDSPSGPLGSMSDLDPALLSDLPQRRQRIPLEQHSQSLVL